MLRYINNVLRPWMNHWKELHLPAEQKALLIMDVFKAHNTPGVRELLEENGFVVEFVPANCTSELQPLDV